MSESEERTGLEPRPFPKAVGGVEEEEPPGKPRRHPLWRNVPDHQWDDWRWQSQNAIRSVRQLRDLLSFTSGGTGSHRLSRDRVQDGHPAVLLLPDQPRRSQRSDPPSVRALAAGTAESVGLRTGRSAGGGQGLAGARPDAPLPGPRACWSPPTSAPCTAASARASGPRWCAAAGTPSAATTNA